MKTAIALVVACVAAVNAFPGSDPGLKGPVCKYGHGIAGPGPVQVQYGAPVFGGVEYRNPVFGGVVQGQPRFISLGGAGGVGGVGAVGRGFGDEDDGRFGGNWGNNDEWNNNNNNQWGVGGQQWGVGGQQWGTGGQKWGVGGQQLGLGGQQQQWGNNQWNN